jgi:hypothetical protein
MPVLAHMITCLCLLKRSAILPIKKCNVPKLWFTTRKHRAQAVIAVELFTL